MKNNVLISIKSKQSIDEDGIEVITPGAFNKVEDGFVATYNETKLSGMEGTVTTLKILKDTLILIREGNTIANMKFQKGKEDISLYDTRYGTLEMRITTKDMSVNISEDGGNIMVNYELALTGQEPYTTILEINIQ